MNIESRHKVRYKHFKISCNSFAIGLTLCKSSIFVHKLNFISIFSIEEEDTNYMYVTFLEQAYIIYYNIISICNVIDKISLFKVVFICISQSYFVE